MNGGCGRWGRVKVRGTSGEAAPVVVGVLVEAGKPTGAGRHGLAVEDVGLLCWRLGVWPEWRSESGDI